MSIKKGQVLIFVLFFLAIISVILGSTAVMWSSELKMRSGIRDRMIALYLAQAAVERAKVEIVRDVTLTGDKPNSGNDDLASSWYQELDIAGDNYTFRYKYNVTINGLQRTIIGRGRVVDSTNKLLAEKDIVVIVSGIQDDGTGKDKNPPNNTVTNWQES
ncbi:MAG: hypothetical protein PHN57_00240 [Candidatus Omnitrophica bacterium]|nr:hypothetical protein [Candidatus Omnitrophota bacterium]